MTNRHDRRAAGKSAPKCPNISGTDEACENCKFSSDPEIEAKVIMALSKVELPAGRPAPQSQVRTPMDLNEFNRVAQKFQSTAPVPVMGIANELGVKVWRSALGKDVSGKLFRDTVNGGTSGYSIIVNGFEPYVRQRFTMAHEIGHFVLHLDSVGSEIVDDTFYRSRLSNKLEAEANKFAADLLMPKALIEKLENEGVNSPEGLAKALSVSQVAMKIRLGIPVT